MHVNIGLNTGEQFYDGSTKPAKNPRGVHKLVTEVFDTPEDIPFSVSIEYDPAFDSGDMRIYIGGVEMARVAPLRAGTNLLFRLPSDELLWIVTRK